MARQSALEIVQRTRRKKHVRLKSLRHAEIYFNKDSLYLRPRLVSYLCLLIAQHFFEYPIDVVAAPAIGGVALTQWTVFHLDSLTGQDNDNEGVAAVYAEKDKFTDRFVLRREYDEAVAGKNVLLLDDILTTGGSVKEVIELIRALGGKVIAVAAICNRGRVTAEGLGVDELFTLADIEERTWTEDECPLCKAGVPIDLNLGKGVKLPNPLP